MPTYRIEEASTGRAGCKNKECLDKKEKILKGELRLGSWVESERFQSWSWKHWGCVTPKQIASMYDIVEGDDFTLLDGYDEISAENQEKVREAVAQGHVADSDWKGDVEMNRPGKVGFRVRVSKKKAAADKKKKVTQDDHKAEKPKSSKKRKAKSEESDEEEEEEVEEENEKEEEEEEPVSKKAKASSKKRKSLESSPEKKKAKKEAAASEEKEKRRRKSDDPTSKSIPSKVDESPKRSSRVTRRSTRSQKSSA